MHALRIACLTVLLSIAHDASAATTIDYVFTGESAAPGKPARSGENRTTSVIDGAHFVNTSGRGQRETSDDDGATTWFGDDRTVTQTPLVRDVARPWDPIAGFVEDEHLVIGASKPGPVLFGMPTRIYTVDHRYTIVARVLLVLRRGTPNHAAWTITVADDGVSSAALRVAFSRGYGYALAMHPEAFTGLPLSIEGTIESGDPPYNVAHVGVRAVSLQQ